MSSDNGPTYSIAVCFVNGTQQSVSEHADLLAEKQQFEGELVRMIENHRSFPCIVQYVVFNEGWGQYDVGPLSSDLYASPSNQGPLPAIAENASVKYMLSQPRP